MSLKALAWAWDQNDVSSAEKLVLLGLANYSNRDSSVAYPSVATLAKDCCLSESSVRRAVTSLERRSLLMVFEDLAKGGNSSNIYVLNLNGAQGFAWESLARSRARTFARGTASLRADERRSGQGRRQSRARQLKLGPAPQGDTPGDAP